ncbi:MAG TPA: nitrate reductase molybdenum cofactor assembly chaperone [Bacilli bacterium]
MREEQRAVLIIASRLLSYPAENVWAEVLEIQTCIRECIDSKALRIELSQAAAAFLALPHTELQEQYVATFDLRENTGLYLTAHELGDSRKRGMALVELQNLLKENGYQPPEGELADYIPMLCELLAAGEDSPPLQQLKGRLAVAVKRIWEHLPEDSLYRPVFAALTRAVFGEPAANDIAEAERGRETADLDPLPYPLMYL